MLRREIWVDPDGEVTRYNLAYVNRLWCGRDHGRVLGYDNAHGLHHRHFMGERTNVEFRSFAEIEGRFELDWRALMKERNRAKDRNPG